MAEPLFEVSAIGPSFRGPFYAHLALNRLQILCCSRQADFILQRCSTPGYHLNQSIFMLLKRRAGVIARLEAFMNGRIRIHLVRCR